VAPFGTRAFSTEPLRETAFDAEAYSLFCYNEVLDASKTNGAGA
jgi:hypothetical protein